LLFVYILHAETTCGATLIRKDYYSHSNSIATCSWLVQVPQVQFIGYELSSRSSNHIFSPL